MTENGHKPLSLGGVDRDARPSVDVFERAYRLKAITRSVERALDQAGRKIDELQKDDTANADGLVTILADAIDQLLEPEGNNRTPAKKIILEKWKADDLAIDELRRFADSLQEQAVSARPT